jgi:YD repeat-containing protein
VCGVRCLRGQLWNRYWRRWQDYHDWRFPSWGCAYNQPPNGSLYRTNTGWIDGGHPYEVCPAPPPKVPDKQLGARCSKNKRGGSLVGNPCNAGSGNKIQTEIDLADSGIGLQFLRHYNSGTNADVGLGRGWTSSLHSRLEIDVDALVVRAPDGRGEPWLKNNGVWRGDPDSRLVLAEDASGYELRLPSGETKRYDSGGRMTLQRSPDGRQTTYSYDVGGRLEQIMGPFGHRLELGYDVDGHLVQLTDPGGSIFRYHYDNKSNLVGVVYPDSTPENDSDNPRRSYLYENRKYPNLLTGIIDEEGHRYASFEYDDAGRASSTEHAVTSNGVAQERFSLTYDGPSQTTVTDPVGERWVYQFANNLGSRNLLSRTSLADGRASSQDFDANNNLVSRTDEEGRTITYTYNANNQRTSMTEAAGTAEARTTTYEYVTHDVDLPTRVVTPSIVPGFDKEVLTQYDDVLNVISITRKGYQPDGTPVSRTIGFQYNAHGQVIRIDGPRTDVADITTLAYNECAIGGGCGQLASITNPLGQTTTYDNHDAYGRVKQATDPNGLVTTFDYDVRGRIAAVRQIPPAGQGVARVNTYTYDSLGQVSSVTTPDGVTLTNSYDAARDLRTVTDNLGNRVEYLYDPKGNRIKVRPPRSRRHGESGRVGHAAGS